MQANHVDWGWGVIPVSTTSGLLCARRVQCEMPGALTVYKHHSPHVHVIDTGQHPGPKLLQLQLAPSISKFWFCLRSRDASSLCRLLVLSWLKVVRTSGGPREFSLSPCSVFLASRFSSPCSEGPTGTPGPQLLGRL